VDTMLFSLNYIAERLQEEDGMAIPFELATSRYFITGTVSYNPVSNALQVVCDTISAESTRHHRFTVDLVTGAMLGTSERVFVAIALLFFQVNLYGCRTAWNRGAAQKWELHAKMMT